VGEAIRDRANGLLVPREDFQAMAAALGMLIEDAGARKRLGTAARLDYGKEFRLERMVEDTLAVYGTVVDSSKHSWSTV
jgi:glycosyltransferase involved in cell wall biosynthesis